MSTDSSTRSADRERILELLADRALFGISEEESSELQTLQQAFPEIRDNEMDEIVAAVDASSPALASRMALPTTLREQILQHADAADSTASPTTEIRRKSTHAEESTLRPNAPAWARRAVLIACTAAATLLAVAGLDAYRSNSKTPVATVSEQRSELLASAEDVIEVDWTATDENSPAVGNVVWSDSKQTGFMTFKGLPVNDPNVDQYQLWIFDSEQDERYPVDGGVFDIVGDEVVVPIQSKIDVKAATMFAITIEKPGGVVVSDRSRLPLLAKVASK